METHSSDRKTVPLPKIFGIIGFVLGEIYMLFTVLAPNLKTVETPALSLLWRALAMALLFGPFGLAAGTGIGILLDSLRRRP